MSFASNGEVVPKIDDRVAQAETRTEQAESRTEQAKTRTEQAELRTEQAEIRTEQAETRTEQAKTRTEQAEIRTEQAETQSEQAIHASELRYRRLFETAQDGILILDANTGQVMDANPFMKDLLGYSQEEFLGKKLWEIGPFKGEAASKITFAELQRTDRLRYEGLPLETKEGLRVEVEFVSNAYYVDQHRLSIELLKETATDPQAASILKTIQASATRGADIVRQVLSFARGMEGEKIEVQLNNLLRELRNIIKDTFPKDIELQFNLPNDLWTILGDPTQVHQILLNLCVNARDAMPDGGTLTVSVENCLLDKPYFAMNLPAKPGRYVNISVTDTGIGIPKDLLDKIFEPFFTTKELSKGTGLGLSTVMAIVKSHEGTLNVYSEPGKGTVFKVYLPASSATNCETKDDQPDELSLLRGSGETILMIDDEPSIISVTGQTLKAFGYEVLTATDGAEALALYAQNQDRISVVLTDMMMPVLDGAAVIRVLNRMNPSVKIIAASGLSTNGGVAKVSASGVKHFLTKPYSAGSLLKTLRMILDEA